MKKILSALIITIVLSVQTCPATASGDLTLFNEGLKYLKQGHRDFGILKLRRVINSNKKSKYAERAHKEIISYYYDEGLKNEALAQIDDYIAAFPEGENKEFIDAIADKIIAEYLEEKGKMLAKKERWDYCVDVYKEVVLILDDEKYNSETYSECVEQLVKEEQMKAEGYQKVDGEWIKRMKKTREEVIAVVATAMGTTPEDIMQSYEAFWTK